MTYCSDSKAIEVSHCLIFSEFYAIRPSHTMDRSILLAHTRLDGP